MICIEFCPSDLSTKVCPFVILDETQIQQLRSVASTFHFTWLFQEKQHILIGDGLSIATRKIM